MQGKIIVIEGTDCSGKETQSKLLVSKLKEAGKKVETISFPMYDTATGRIVGACLLGKPDMCKEYLTTTHSFFEEGGGNIDSLVACCYYAADRRYHLPKIKELLANNDYLIIDRYTTSNMAHRGGLITDKEERIKMYKKIEMLEYDLLELPRPDKVIFLYMPYNYACELKKNRTEKPDEVESDIEYLKRGEASYLELAELYNYQTINCVENNKIRSIEDINNEIYQLFE